jgi:hypothetical protein
MPEEAIFTGAFSGWQRVRVHTTEMTEWQIAVVVGCLGGIIFLLTAIQKEMREIRAMLERQFYGKQYPPLRR